MRLLQYWPRDEDTLRWLTNVAVALVYCRFPAEDAIATMLFFNRSLGNPVPPRELVEELVDSLATLAPPHEVCLEMAVRFERKPCPS